MDYSMQQKLGSALDTCAPQMPTIRERMKMNLEAAQKRVVELQEAMALLDKNPDYERLADLLSRNAY